MKYLGKGCREGGERKKRPTCQREEESWETWKEMKEIKLVLN